MTDEELEELVTACPTLYHMAERGARPAIEEHGLLSTSALLDLYDVEQPQRDKIENYRRPKCVRLYGDGLPGAVIRKQTRLSRKKLKNCLAPPLTPQDWYRCLNSKCFFWLTKKRLHKFTTAKAFRDKEHDVLEVDTRSLIKAHRPKIWLCPINSGAIHRSTTSLDKSIFARIANYPYTHWKAETGNPEESIVELAVDHCVSDIQGHVKRVIVTPAIE